MSELPTKIVVVRHGESWANRYGVIVSKPEHGNKVAGLTPEGELQIRRATRIALRDSIIDSNNTVIYSSQLRRCRESAKIIAEESGIKEFGIRSELNERNFGKLEFGDHSKYELVYAEDRRNPDNHMFGVESILDIHRRATLLINELEEAHKGKTVVLVTHKDVSEILQTVLRGIPPEKHRDRTVIPKHENSEFRMLH